MPDQTLQCVDCKSDFQFTERDQQFFQDKGFTPPKRCKPCRDLKKQQMGSSGGNRQGYRSGNR